MRKDTPQRMGRRHLRRHDHERSVVLLYLMFIACGPTENGRVRYSASSPLHVCEGTQQYIEEFVPFLEQELGIIINSLLEYSWLDEMGYPTANCPSQSAGCQVENHAYSRKPVSLHELIHAATYQSDMNNLRFFTEGVAVAYDPLNGTGVGPRYRFNPPEGEVATDPRELLLGMLEPGSYDVAGRFVTFLILRHGPEKIVEISRSLDVDSSLEQIESRFLQVYGVALDVEADLFTMNGPCDDMPYDVLLYDCAMREVPWSDSRWSWSATMSCSDEDVAGGVDVSRPSTSVLSASLSVPQTGRYTLSLEGDSGAQLTMGRCSGCPWWPQDIVLSSVGKNEVDLSAGPYFVRLTAPSERTLELGVTLVRAK